MHLLLAVILFTTLISSQRCDLGYNFECGTQCCNHDDTSAAPFKIGTCGPCPVNHCPPSIANNPYLCINGRLNMMSCHTAADCPSQSSLCCVSFVDGFIKPLPGSGWCGPCPPVPPPPPPPVCCLIKGQKHCGLSCFIPPSSPPPPICCLIGGRQQCGKICTINKWPPLPKKPKA